MGTFPNGELHGEEPDDVAAESRPQNMTLDAILARFQLTMTNRKLLEQQAPIMSAEQAEGHLLLIAKTMSAGDANKETAVLQLIKNVGILSWGKRLFAFYIRRWGSFSAPKNEEEAAYLAKGFAAIAQMYGALRALER